MKIAILGGQHSILGFQSLGLSAFGVFTIEEARAALSEIKKSDEYGVLFVTEDWAARLDTELNELAKKPLPAIVAIPSQKGSTGEGIKNLKRIVERAIGSDILFKDS